MNTTRERRRHIRVPGPITGRIESKHADIEVRDLSEGGCFINWKSEAPKPGDRFELTLVPEGGPSITVGAETVYSHPGEGFGVLFTEVSGAAFAKVEQLVAKLRRQSGS